MPASTPETDGNRKLQMELGKVETLPLYVVVSPDGKVLKIHQQQPPLNDAGQFLGAIRPFGGSVVATRAVTRPPFEKGAGF